jgi:hypothetical protein
MDSIAEERHIHMAKYAWQYFCEAGLHCFSKLFALGRNRDRATVSLRRNAPLEPPPPMTAAFAALLGAALREMRTR